MTIAVRAAALNPYDAKQAAGEGGADPTKLPRRLGGEAAGIFHVIVRVGIGHGGHFDQLGAAEPQHVLLFLALGVGDDDHRAIAERIADQGQADAGIAGGAFDDDAARA